jgi:hypothetical protein
VLTRINVTFFDTESKPSPLESCCLCDARTVVDAVTTPWCLDCEATAHEIAADLSRV